MIFQHDLLSTQTTLPHDIRDKYTALKKKETLFHTDACVVVKIQGSVAKRLYFVTCIMINERRAFCSDEPPTLGDVKLLLCVLLEN